MNKYTDQFGDRFQKQILSVLTRHQTYVMRYRTAIAPEYFTNPLHAAIVEALLDQVDTYKKVPTEATLFHVASQRVAKDKRQGLEVVFSQLYAADISDADSVMSLAVEFGQTQALCDAVLRSADKIEKGDRAAIKSLINTAMQVGEDLLSVGRSFKGTLEKRATGTDEAELTAERIPTGIQHVDYAMSGGLGRGELGVIVAPPARGKSTLLVNIGYGALLAGHNVVHYSLEMKEQKILQRYDARLAGAYSKLKWSDKQTYATELQRRAHKFIKGDLIVKEYPTRKATVSTIYSHLSLLSAQGMHPSLIIVDYADIMKPEKRLGEFRHEQAGIYEDLRALASEVNAAVWTASQANKGSLDKATITMADFAECFEKAAIVDAAWGLSQTLSERSSRTCRLFAAKLRDTEDGLTVACNLDRARCQLISTAIYDSGNNRVDAGEYVLAQAREEAEKAKGTNKEAAAAAKELVLAAKKPEHGTVPRYDDGTPKLGTGSATDLHQSTAKRVMKSTGKSRSDRPSAKVPPA
jgi:replicative DNA helicase